MKPQRAHVRSSSTSGTAAGVAKGAEMPSFPGNSTSLNTSSLPSSKPMSPTTVINVVAGPKGVPLTKEGVVLSASTLAPAFSTASESELLACGLTPDELEDLEIKATPVVGLPKGQPMANGSHKSASAW